MFGLFQPRCPVDVREKVWTEQRMQWLIQQFGPEQMLKTEVILPTVEFFPEAFDEGEREVQLVAARVFDYMGVDCKTIDVLIAPDDDMPNAAGMYEKGERTKIHVAESQLEDLETLIATLAHESAHALLLGQDRLTGEEKDHEHVTDLVMVYSGMGIFAANTAVQHHTRQGYLPARVFGYAFALFAWIRHESSPPWAAYLGSDAADTFGKGLKYLSKTTDCLFDRETVDRKLSNRSEHELLSSLDDASESVQLAAIHELREQATPTTDVVDAIARLLRHENPILCCEAAQALGAIRLVTDPVINGLMTNLSDDDAVVQADSVAALGELCPPLEFCGPYETSVRDELERLIDHSNPNVVLATIGTMAAYKTAFSEAAPKVWKVLLQAVFDCKYANSDYLVAMLTAIVPDREAFLTQQLSAEDDDVRHQVMDAVRHADAIEAE